MTNILPQGRRDHRLRLDRGNPRARNSPTRASTSSRIERGPWRDTATDFNIGYAQDELRYAVRQDLFLQPATKP